MEGGVERARQTGFEAVAALRRSLAERTAQLIRSDPDAADAALEMGLVDARWLEDPTAHDNIVSPPSQVLERFLERTVAARPSRLGALGLGAVQLITSLAHGGPTASVRDLSVVFTDLEGFTPFTDREGDQAALDLLTVHHRDAGATVRRNGGRIVKRLGDGLMCAFEDPNAAVRASLGLIGTDAGPLRVRAGANVGETFVTADDLVGHAVNVAARVTEVAGGGEVVATADLVRAAGPVTGAAYGPGRKVRLKGVADPVVVHRVVPGPPAV